jgi:hypothetical protein
MNEDEKAFFAYTKIAEQISREDTLIHQRTTNGLTVNGVLATSIFAVYRLTIEDIGKGGTQDYIILIFSVVVLGLAAIWVNYTTIRQISYARTQNRYLKNYYLEHWQNKMINELHLPQPFGGTVPPYKDESGKPIKVGAGEWGSLFRALMIIWMIGLVAMTGWAFGFLSH